MTSFGWKRKIGANVSKTKSEDFERNSKEETEEIELEDGEISWLSLVPKRRLIHLEDAKSKSARLQEEGVVLAEQERYKSNLKYKVFSLIIV